MKKNLLFLVLSILCVGINIIFAHKVQTSEPQPHEPEEIKDLCEKKKCNPFCRELKRLVYCAKSRPSKAEVEHLKAKAKHTNEEKEKLVSEIYCQHDAWDDEVNGKSYGNVYYVIEHLGIDENWPPEKTAQYVSQMIEYLKFLEEEKSNNSEHKNQVLIDEEKTT